MRGCYAIQIDPSVLSAYVARPEPQKLPPAVGRKRDPLTGAFCFGFLNGPEGLLRRAYDVDVDVNS